MEFKFNEDTTIKELLEHVEKSYGQHYVGKNEIQSIEYMDTLGAAVGFAQGNIIKYASRYGKKKGYNRDDIMKVMHYCLLLLHFSELEQQREEEQNEISRQKGK